MNRNPRKVLRSIALGAVVGAFVPLGVGAQEPGTVVEADPRVEGRSYIFEETGAEIPYALFVPSDYDPARTWPLIVGLHGLGRPFDWLMGYDGIVDLAEERGYIMVTPLGYHPRGWYGSRGPGISSIPEAEAAELPSNLGELSERDVMNVLGIVREELNIDPARIYLWGHSMGGAGTYHLAARHPDLWAGLAVAAPAPSVPPGEQLPAFRHVPILVLHGTEDAVVPVARSREWVAVMQELGMEHVYVEVPGGDHSSFLNADREMVARIFGFFDVVRKDFRRRTVAPALPPTSRTGSAPRPGPVGRRVLPQRIRCPGHPRPRLLPPRPHRAWNRKRVEE